LEVTTWKPVAGKPAIEREVRFHPRKLKESETLLYLFITIDRDLIPNFLAVQAELSSFANKHRRYGIETEWGRTSGE